MYEYVDNGNLDQWLHGDVGEVSPLTWDIRMNVILGTAKGYCPYITSLFFFFGYIEKNNHVLMYASFTHLVLSSLYRLAYLHEGLEPKVVHRDVKSSNILVDRQWHPKVSDFGLAKLLCSENSYVTTRVMGTFGLVHIFIFFFF